MYILSVNMQVKIYLYILSKNANDFQHSNLFWLLLIQVSLENSILPPKYYLTSFYLLQLQLATPNILFKIGSSE